jgi:Putative transposase
VPRPRRYAPWAPIRSTWALRSVSSPSYIPWGENLLHHPHLHCVVPGGGVSPDGQRWVRCQPGFFLPVRVLSRLFRRLFLALLREAYDARTLKFYNALAGLQNPSAFASYLAPIDTAEWVVYAKRPFGGPERVLEYLGRYTHRVAIANSRLVEFADGQVSFRWKDYRHESHQKVMRLVAAEFVRRFLLHALPSGFQRIRHYGLLANRNRELKLQRCRQLLEAPAPAPVRPMNPRTIAIAVSGSPACRCGSARTAGAGG